MAEKKFTSMPVFDSVNQSPPSGNERQDQRVRLQQKDILPTAIKNRNFGDVIRTLPNDFTTSITATATGVANGNQVVLYYTTESVHGNVVMSDPDISFYIGSVAADNQLPGGASIDESQWQMIGPFTDWGATDNKNSIKLIYIRNISAGTVDIIAKGRSRFIANVNAGSATAS